MQQGPDRGGRGVPGRKEVRLAGRLILGDGTRLPCMVRKISPMGANFELESDTALPSTFRLQIPADLFEVECALRNQDGHLVGVEFTSSRAEAMARYS